MKDEIKEILDLLKYCVEKNEYLEEPNMKKWKPLLDYITNLQEELKEYKMIFDAFSKRPYAHRYLEEKKKELGNSKIIGLDSEMIYKDYYDLKEENERLHKELDYANNDNIYYIAKIDKAIEKLETLMPICIMLNNTLIHGTEKAKIIEETLNILNGDDE